MPTSDPQSRRRSLLAPPLGGSSLIPKTSPRKSAPVRRNGHEIGSGRIADIDDPKGCRHETSSESSSFPEFRSWAAAGFRRTWSQPASPTLAGRRQDRAELQSECRGGRRALDSRRRGALRERSHRDRLPFLRGSPQLAGLSRRSSTVRASAVGAYCAFSRSLA